MRIGFIQYDVSHNVHENIAKVSNLIQNNYADIFLLPELCDLGYLHNSREELFQKSSPLNENKMICFLKKLSVERHCAFIAGVAEKDDYHIYNSAVLLKNGEIIGTYRKIHLSDFEKAFFTPGISNTVFTMDNVKIGVQICFDLWFPEMSREQIRQGSNLLCAIGNFGNETTYHISKIRAIENLTPLILCNRVGNEKNIQIDAYFLGRSSIIESNGIELVDSQDDIETCKVCDITLSNSKGNVICKDFLSEINKHYI